MAAYTEIRLFVVNVDSSVGIENPLFSIMRRFESHQCFHFFFVTFIVKCFHMNSLIKNAPSLSSFKTHLKDKLMHFT